MELAGRLRLDPSVTYVVDQTALRAASAGTSLEFRVFADSDCSSVIHTATVSIESVDLIERVRTFKIRGAPLPPRVARLSHALEDAPTSPTYFVTVSGTGIVPVGAGCQPQVASSSSALPCATQVDNEVYFTGCNVNIRNGLGHTDGGGNGLGNLVVGYNETDGTRQRRGSHNLIVGPNHAYDSNIGMAVGVGHRLEGSAVSVTGGIDNVAAGFGSTVSGGTSNVAGKPTSGPTVFAIGATVSRGTSNNAYGDFAAVSGGVANVARARGAAASGGFGADVSGQYASVAGGLINRAAGAYATIAGGASNAAGDASTAYATVAGGTCNSASAAPAVCTLPSAPPIEAPTTLGATGTWPLGARPSSPAAL
jgi:hypothetical protein